MRRAGVGGQPGTLELLQALQGAVQGEGPPPSAPAAGEGEDGEELLLDPRVRRPRSHHRRQSLAWVELRTSVLCSVLR